MMHKVLLYEVNNTPTVNGTQLFVKQAGALDLVIPTAFGVGYNINNLKISFTLRLTGGDPGAANILTIIPTLNGNVINPNLTYNFTLVNGQATDIQS